MSSLVLASSSPRRLELLSQIGVVPDKICPSDIDETKNPKESISLYAKRMAVAKARAVFKDNPSSFVLAADTVVALGIRVLFKTDEKDKAISNLKLLSGRRHKVISTVCLIEPNGKEHIRAVSSVVKFKRLTDTEIAEYIKTNEWKGKAGSYAIQGAIAKYITHISGSYSGIVGLPLFETSCLLNLYFNAK